MTDNEAIITGPRLTQEVTSTGRGPKPEARAPSLGGGDVEGSPQHCPRTIKMALRPEHLAVIIISGVLICNYN